jgi:hypothetical protein
LIEGAVEGAPEPAKAEYPFLPDAGGAYDGACSVADGAGGVYCCTGGVSF